MKSLPSRMIEPLHPDNLTRLKTDFYRHKNKHKKGNIKMKAKIREIKLTEREQKILEMLSYGWCNSEIAAHYRLSLGSINSAIVNLLRKTQASNRTHLVRWGFENNYLR